MHHHSSSLKHTKVESPTKCGFLETVNGHFDYFHQQFCSAPQYAIIDDCNIYYCCFPGPWNYFVLLLLMFGCLGVVGSGVVFFCFLCVAFSHILLCLRDEMQGVLKSCG